IDLAQWASWRWAGRVVHVFDTASNAQGSVRSGTVRAEPGVTLLRLPPTTPRPTFDGELVIEGRRSTVWAPAAGVETIVVGDEHDEALQEERAPTWHARDVAIERARRAGIPCVLLSPCPSLEAPVVADRVIEPSRADERAGWPILEIVDRRRDDPRSGLYSE